MSVFIYSFQQTKFYWLHVHKYRDITVHLQISMSFMILEMIFFMMLEQ